MLDNDVMGQFLMELRRDKDLTQDEVAVAIGTTESEVGRWEHGKSSPEMNYIQPLANLYGVTVNELLNGKRYVADEASPSEQDLTNNILDYANKNIAEQFKNTRREWLISITAVLAFVIVACIVIDLVSVGRITWSGIAGVSIVFAWGIILPLFFKLATPMMSSLIAFSALIIPYLFALDLVIGANSILTNVAIPITLVSLVYLWALYFVFVRMNLSIWRFLAVVAFGAVPVTIVINLVVSMQFDVPLITVWNILSVILLIAIGAGFIYWEQRGRKVK